MLSANPTKAQTHLEDPPEICCKNLTCFCDHGFPSYPHQATQERAAATPTHFWDTGQRAGEPCTPGSPEHCASHIAETLDDFCESA